MKNVQPPPRMETVGGEAPAPDATGPLLWVDAEIMCGAGARIHLRTYTVATDPPGEQDKVVDAMMRVGLRQRAIAELPDLVKDLAEKESVIEARKKAEAEMLERRPSIIAERLKSKQEAEAAVERATKDYATDWAARRQGPVVVSAQQKAKVQQLMQAAFKAEADYQNAIQQEAADKSQFDANTVKWDAELVEARRLVAEAEKAIAGG